MRTAVSTLMAACLAAATCGCASYAALPNPNARIDRAGLIDNPRQAARLERAMTDRQIADLLDMDVQAKLPTSLAVAKLVVPCPGDSPHLAQMDAVELAAWKDVVTKIPEIRGLQSVTPGLLRLSLYPGPLTLRSLRVAAAKEHCGLLLVYLQADSSVDNFTDAAALYWSFVGLWLVPGDCVEHKTVMQAVLLDCRTGAILGTAIGDAHLHRFTPAAFVDIQQGKLAREAPAQAERNLRAGCAKLLAQVVHRAEKCPKRKSKRK